MTRTLTMLGFALLAGCASPPPPSANLAVRSTKNPEQVRACLVSALGVLDNRPASISTARVDGGIRLEWISDALTKASVRIAKENTTSLVELYEGDPEWRHNSQFEQVIGQQCR